MAAGQAVEFDKIIQDERARKKNTALAEEIFGKARKSGASTPRGGGGKGKGDGVSSLASRVGVQKPTSSQKSQKPNNPFQSPNNPAFSHNSLRTRHRLQSNQRSVSTSRIERIASSLQNTEGIETSFRSSTNTLPGKGLSIRGTAGPFAVVAQNFAPGTTAADIESAMLPVGGTITSCRITQDLPNVVAEIIFLDKAGADAVVSSFNKQKADGRILELYHKSNTHLPPSNSRLDQSPVVIDADSPSVSQRSATGRLTPQTFNNSNRETSDLSRRDGRRLAEPEVQDGSYGFMDVDTTPQPPAGPREDRVRDRDGRDREIYRDSPRGPRGQQQDRQYNRNYDRRPENGNYSSSYYQARDDRGYSRRGNDRAYGRNGRRHDTYHDRQIDDDRNCGSGDMDVDMDQPDNTGRGQGRGQGTGEARPRDRGSRLYSDDIVREGTGRGGWGRGRDYGR